MKNRTASRAMRPGKKRYMALLKPIASPTCSTKIPRVPETAEQVYFWLKVSKSDHFISSSYLRWRSSRRERRHCRRPWCWLGQSPRWRWRGLRTRSPRTDNTELKVMSDTDTSHVLFFKLLFREEECLICLCVHIPSAMKQYGGSR